MTARAITADQKRAIVEQLLAAWEKRPGLRLGQLLMNAASGVAPVYYIEDDALAEAVEAFAKGDPK